MTNFMEPSEGNYPYKNCKCWNNGPAECFSNEHCCICSVEEVTNLSHRKCAVCSLAKKDCNCENGFTSDCKSELHVCICYRKIKLCSYCNEFVQYCVCIEGVNSRLPCLAQQHCNFTKFIGSLGGQKLSRVCDMEIEP